jgi:hypothetical protein
MRADNRTMSLEPLALARHASLPAHERVLDRLADLLFDADDLLDMLRAEDTMRMHWVEPHIQRVYDEVNDVMKELCD